MTETLSSQLPSDREDAISAFLASACEAELTPATAGRRTRGSLVSMLTDADGCSHAFERGFVVYTDDPKREALGVPEALLVEHGAVSDPVACAMAESALGRSLADIALAVPPFAGPTGGRREEGLVPLACARRGRRAVYREVHCEPLGRGGVRIACLGTAIEMFQEALS